MIFKNRKEAGQKLAEALRGYADKKIVVYALPRGGVVVGVEVAQRLASSLDLVIPRKIGHPYDPEYALAAVTENGDVVADAAEIAAIDEDWFDKEIKEQKAEAKRRRETYLGNAASPAIEGAVAIIVDDGIATGLTMKAAIQDLRRRHPKQIVVAVPVAPQDTLAEISKLVDRVVCLFSPKEPGSFGAIGEYYGSFPQVKDNEVVDLMKHVKKI